MDALDLLLNRRSASRLGPLMRLVKISSTRACGHLTMAHCSHGVS